MSAAWPFGALKRGHYGLILADVPWPTQTWSDEGKGKSPERHYVTMSLEAIAALPVAELAAEDCALVFWARWIQLREALDVIDAWGFRQVSGGSWQKRTVNLGKTFGTGYWFRNATEPFLFATRGRPQRRSKSVRDSITTKLELITALDGERRGHSRKPDEMRANLDLMFPDVPGCELFARAPWPGRDVWGNETGKFAAEDAA